MKTVLFGLDGATFTVLDPLMASGLMPNLQRFCEQGTRSKLASTPMPVTPQAWTSLATGRGAGHHGIHDFIRCENRPEGVFFRVNDSRDNHCEAIWQYASREGRTVTVLNYFGLAPPRNINGHSMPGFVSGRHLRRSSHPPDLFERLDRVVEGAASVLGLDMEIERQGLQDMEPEQWKEWIGHHIRRERAWSAVLEHLMRHEPSDLTAIVLDGVDKIQHLAYRFLDPALVPSAPNRWESEIISLCHQYFSEVDEFLGRVIELVGPQARIFIASDHGFTATTEVVYINKWLNDEGFLTWRGEADEDHQNSIFSPRLATLANNIDLSRTQAYALTPSCNGIFINATGAEQKRIENHLVRALKEFRAPDGERVVTEIKLRDEWFAGPHQDRAPDLTLTLRDFGLVSVLNSAEQVVARKQPAGTHHPHGILLAMGPGIRRGEEVAMHDILDVTPLLAHSLELEIPAEYDGIFPENLFTREALAENPPRISRPAEEASESSEDGEAIMDAEDEAIVFGRLKSLGYIE